MGDLLSLEEELVRRCQSGDRRAFGQLVEKYGQNVFNLLYRLAPSWMSVDDLAQDIWLKVYQSIGKLQNPASFRSWLNRITVNTFHDRLRQHGHHIEFSIDDPLSTEDGGEIRLELSDTRMLPEDVLLDNEWLSQLEKAIQKLPEPYRLVVIMREIQQLSYEEIAGSLDISLGTVKSRLARARERLIKDLADYMKEAKTNV